MSPRYNHCMRPPHAQKSLRGRQSGRREQGMVILILLFLAAVMLIGATVGAERLVTLSRREKEQELVWRGEQYVRAIKLYYRKYGQFPKSVDDFSKNPGNLHFLRKVYTDPMNTSDGTWRFIYMGAAGQLIGSLTRKIPIGMAPVGMPGGQPGQVAIGAGSGTSSFGSGFGGSSGSGAGGFGSSSFGSSSFGSSGFGSSGAGGSAPAAGAAQLGGAAPNTSQGQGGSIPALQIGADSGTQTTQDTGLLAGFGSDASLSTAMPADFGAATGTGPGPVLPPKKAIEGAQVVDGQVYGGQLVGIASKVDRKSILFYKGYGKYREWEFIWDPAEEAAAAGNLSAGSGVLPSSLVAPPAGTAAPATGTQPPGNPQPPGTPNQPQF